MSQDVLDAARRAREASHTLALATRAQKDAALLAMADALLARSEEVLAANAGDVARAEADGTPAGIVDRLRLTPDRLEDMARGLREVAALPDPVGEVVRGSIHYRALFMVGLVLFVLSLMINYAAQGIVRRYRISIG